MNRLSMGSKVRGNFYFFLHSLVYILWILDNKLVLYLIDQVFEVTSWPHYKDKQKAGG